LAGKKTINAPNQITRKGCGSAKGFVIKSEKTLPIAKAEMLSIKWSGFSEV
jgi:hypothetical protein